MIALQGLFANTLLFFGAWWLAATVFRQSRILDRVLAAAVLGVTWGLLGIESLGSLGLLAIGPLTAWMAILCAAGLLARRLIPGTISAIGPETAAIGLEPWRWESVLAAALVLWVTAELAMQSLLLPVKVVSDGPIYHLYFAVRWWKAGRLFLVAAPFGENAATYFPANGDAWFTWLIVTWGGERLAKVGQAPFLVLAGMAAFRTGRALGVGRNPMLVAVCCFLTSTPFLIFSFEANVDTIFVAFYLTAVYFFLSSLQQQGSTPTLSLGGLAAGLSLGTKPVGVVFVPPLLAFVLVFLAFQSRSAKKTLSALAVLVVCLLFATGFWFGRDLLLTGNPFYPLHVELFGRTILHGWYGRDVMRYSVYYLPMSDWRAFVDILLGMADPRLVPFWVAGLGGVWAIGGRRSSGNDRWTWALAVLALLNVALYWFGIPYRTQPRFMFQALGLAAVPLARLLDRHRWISVAASVLLALHLLTPQTWPVANQESEIPWDMSPLIKNAVGSPLLLFSSIAGTLHGGEHRAPISGPVILLGMGCCAVLTAWSGSRIGRTKAPRNRSLALTALGGFGLVGLAALHTGAAMLDTRQLFYPPFRDFYLGWMDFEGRSGPAGARVAYAGTNIPFYLFGTGLRNDVTYINVDIHRNWLMHDYHRAAVERNQPTWPNSRPGWDRAHPNFADWLANLRAQQVQLLVVTRADPGEGPHNVADRDGFPIERGWADAHPEVFEPLYGPRERDPLFRIYRLRGAS